MKRGKGGRRGRRGRRGKRGEVEREREKHRGESIKGNFKIMKLNTADSEEIKTIDMTCTLRCSLCLEISFPYVH